MGAQPAEERGNATILIVDDEEHVRDFFRRVLEREGYVCDLAGNGRKAFQLTNRNDYRLVIMDIKMPDWDGIDAIVSLGLVNPKQKIMVVSGNLTEEVIREIEREPSVIGWIEKPVPAERLVSLVRLAFEPGSC